MNPPCTSWISNDRLSGLLAGMFIWRSAQLLMGAIGALAMSTGEASMRAGPGMMSLVPAVACGFLGYAYLLKARERWVDFVALLLLALMALGAIMSAALPFLTANPSAFHEGMRMSMIGRAVVELPLIAATTLCLIVLRKRERASRGTETGVPGETPPVVE